MRILSRQQRICTTLNSVQSNSDSMQSFDFLKLQYPKVEPYKVRNNSL